MNLVKKYVVLEHLTLPHRGFRFWSTNTENNTHSKNSGEPIYKEILFTDDTTEAMRISQKVNDEAVPTFAELRKHYADEYEKVKLK